MHQNPGRVDRTERNDDLATSGNSTRLAVAKEFNTDRLLAVECDARDKRAGEHCEIGATHKGIGIGTKDRQAPAVTNTEIADGRTAFALHHFTILVIEGGNVE